MSTIAPPVFIMFQGWCHEYDLPVPPEFPQEEDLLLTLAQLQEKYYAIFADDSGISVHDIPRGIP